MKKLLICTAISLFLLHIISPSAFADKDERLEGLAVVESIKIFTGDDHALKDDDDFDGKPKYANLEATFTSIKSGRSYIFPLTVEGTELSLGLLAAYRDGGKINMIIKFKLFPFKGRVVSASNLYSPKKDN